MDIHKPKPAHSVREFATELGTIVLGILIAIGLEQSVEAWHWHERVGEARTAIHAELQASNRHYEFVIATRACVDQRLTELNQMIEAVAAAKKVAPLGPVGVHIGTALDDAEWQSQRAAQTLVHFPKQELRDLSALYMGQSNMRAWVTQEEEAWSDLRILEGDPNRLGESDITALRRALQRARNAQYLSVFVAERLLAQAEAAHLPKVRADPESVTITCRPLSRIPAKDPLNAI